MRSESGVLLSGRHEPAREEYTIARGPVTASVTGLGASLRALAVDGVEIIESFPSGTRPVWSQGAVLAPWPNRVRDGRWSFGGDELQLDLTEPALGNAIHGLVMMQGHLVTELTSTSVTLAARIAPAPGYPFAWENRVSYSVTDDGLAVEHTLVNLHDEPIPMAVGVHTYPVIGDVATADLTLVIEAAEHMAVDDRLNAVGVEAATGRFDLTRGALIKDLDLDDAFSGLAVRDGLVRHVLRSPDGRSVELWADERFGWVQVFTTDRFPSASGLRTAVAVEPMTAPADAFNSGLGTEWVSPGHEWSVRWGVTLHR